MAPQELMSLQKDSLLSWSWKWCPQCLRLFQLAHKDCLSVFSSDPHSCYLRGWPAQSLSQSAWRMQCGWLWRCRLRNYCTQWSRSQSLWDGSSSSRCLQVVPQFMPGRTRTKASFKSNKERMAVAATVQFGKKTSDEGTLCLPFRWLSKGVASLWVVLFCARGESLSFLCFGGKSLRQPPLVRRQPFWVSYFAFAGLSKWGFVLSPFFINEFNE